MKTLKSAIVAILVTFTMVSLANTDGFKSKVQPIKVVNVTIERAIHITGLALAMYEQLKPEDFINGMQTHYVAEVTYIGIRYRISGTAEQWIRFFKMEADLPFYTKSPIVGI